MIPTDKQLHLYSGGMLAGMLMPFGFEVAWLGVVIAGVGKEIYDKVSGKGTPEWKDAFATIVGGSAIVIWNVIFKG